MSAIFDSLGYVRGLERAGAARAMAEADAARDFILAGFGSMGDVEASTKGSCGEMALLERRLTIELGTFLAVGEIVALQRLLS